MKKYMYLLFTAFVTVGLSACSHNELSKKIATCLGLLGITLSVQAQNIKDNCYEN